MPRVPEPQPRCSLCCQPATTLCTLHVHYLCDRCERVELAIEQQIVAKTKLLKTTKK